MSIVCLQRRRILTDNLSLWQIILDNFFQYDYLIFILAGINIYILIKTSMYAKKLYYILNPQGWIPGGKQSLKELEEKFEEPFSTASESKLIFLRRKTNAYYTLFENITAIFPLLGILGTVVSLIPMVNAMGDTYSGYFFSALTSTLWGIIFAIIFKGCNGYIASQIEDNEKNVTVYLERNTLSLKSESKKDIV